MERSHKVFNPLTLLVLLSIVSPMYCQITAVEDLSQNVNILCDLDRDAHPLYWRIEGRVYELYNVPTIFKVREYEALTLATVDRRMNGWRLQCFFINDDGVTVLGLESILEVIYDRAMEGPDDIDLLQSSLVGRVVLNYQELQLAAEMFTLSWFYAMNTTTHCSNCEYEVAVFTNTEITQNSQSNLRPLMTFPSNRSSVDIESQYLKEMSGASYFRIDLLSGRARSAYYYNVSYNGDIENINAQGDAATFQMPKYLRNRQSVQLIWSKDDNTRCICPPLEELILQCACNAENRSSNVITIVNHTITISNLTRTMMGEGQLMLYFVHSVSNGCMNTCNLRSIAAIYRITQGHPQPPVVNVTSTGTFCFTIPDNPTAPEVYEVNLTDSTGVLTRLSGAYNTSACLNVTSDLYPDVCSPFQLFIAAVNRVGREVENFMLLNGTLWSTPCDCYKEKANLSIASSNLTPTSVELALHCKFPYFMAITINGTGKQLEETTLSCNSMEKISSLTPASNYSLRTVPNGSRLTCSLYHFKTKERLSNTIDDHLWEWIAIPLSIALSIALVVIVLHVLILVYAIIII